MKEANRPRENKKVNVKTPEEGGNGSARMTDVHGENGRLEKMVEGEKIQDR